MDAATLADAFPASLRSDVAAVGQIMPASPLAPASPFVARVGVPYLIRVLGEYVLEIALDVVAAADGSPGLRAAMGEFGDLNAELVALTEQQAGSHWNAYHRARYPSLAGYPPSRLLGEIRG